MTPAETLRRLLAGAAVAALLAGPATAQTDGATPEAGAEPAAGSDAAEDAAAAATAPEDEAAPVDVSAASVLATVDGTEITLGEVISLRRDLPEQYQQLPDEVLSQGILDQMIDQTLMAKAAREAELDDRLDVALAVNNQIRAVLADAWMRQAIKDRLTEERIRAAYDERYGEAEPQEEIRASHILVESEEKARELRAELDAGADFATLAAEHGTDGTASRGGDLGWFVEGDMVPAFSEAAFATEAGEITGPVESPFGWHLINVVDRREKPVPSFEETRERIGVEVARQIQSELLDELRAEAEISVTEPGVPAAAIRATDLIEPPYDDEN